VHPPPFFLQEMYFRHLYARVTPDLRARVASWNNYRDLFGVIISHTTTMQLPSVWLWDMIDEFIYQYQSFALFRGKMAARSAEEEIDEMLAALKRKVRGGG